MSASLLDVSSLEVRFGSVRALRDVSLIVRPGEAVAVLGANGAGKTTLLRTLSGLLRPSRGNVCMRGDNITANRPHVIAAGGLLHVPEGRQVFSRLTITENLLLGCQRLTASRRNDATRFERVYSLFPRLAERRTQLAGTMSGGEQQMLAIARALVGEPDLLMLDEPSMGLAPVVVDAIFDALTEIRKTTSLLIVEQNAERALSLADRVYLLRNGEVMRECEPGKLTGESLQEVYFGG